MLLGGINQASIAESVAERIHAAFQAPFKTCGQEVFTSVSIGIAVSHDGGQDATDLLRSADTAMYYAKNLGPARTAIFSPGMRKEAKARLQTDTDLRRALDRREFELHYQSIVSLENQSVETVEALLRWRHPTRGLLGPADFIPTAEETGLIVPIGYWVLAQAAADLQGWQKQNSSVTKLRMAVNLSVRQLAIPDLAQEFERIVRDAGITPDRVEFEITENSVMIDAETARRTLEQLKAKGFRLSIDDFGTGHSSLSYVHKFPIDRIKVDRSFLLRGRTERETEVVIRAIVDIGEQLGLEVVAEGIETQSELAKLKAINCKFGQGYLFSAPESSVSMSKRLSPKAIPGPSTAVRNPQIN